MDYSDKVWIILQIQGIVGKWKMQMELEPLEIQLVGI